MWTLLSYQIHPMQPISPSTLTRLASLHQAFSGLLPLWPTCLMPSWFWTTLFSTGTFCRQLCGELEQYIHMALYCPFPFRTTGVYLLIVRRIIVKDMLKFAIIFLITLYIFVGSFYLALRAGVTVNMSTGDIASDVERFSLQTL